MHVIVQKVLQTEAEAKQLVELARAEGECIVSGARKQAEELVARARQEAQNESQELIESARRRAEQERQQVLALTLAAIQAQVCVEEPLLREVIDAAARCVSGQDLQPQSSLP